VTRPSGAPLAAAALLLVGCSEPAALGPQAERGRQVYQAQCTACHHPTDPSRPGAVGPELKGTPRAVLEAKLLHGAYPEGYRPRRPTNVMPPLPQVGPELDALAEYLK
jgi:mono/diheme cytochrome c family protein